LTHPKRPIRSTSSIPIIDYNQRNEKTDIKSLEKRGYDKKGTPFATCGVLCKSNGTCKSSDLDILESPRIYGSSMASIKATMACITTLLKQVMRFVIEVTLNLMKYLKTWDKMWNVGLMKD